MRTNLLKNRQTCTQDSSLKTKNKTQVIMQVLHDRNNSHSQLSY